MKNISLDGIWKCKPDLEDIHISENWFDSKNYDENNENLIGLEIPNSFIEKTNYLNR